MIPWEKLIYWSIILPQFKGRIMKWTKIITPNSQTTLLMIILQSQQFYSWTQYGREVLTYIKRLNAKKATGVDLVSNILLKELPKKGIVYIVKVINAVINITLCILPDKPNKNSNFVKNYRPISLLSHLSKLTEKVILKRINDHLFSKNILIPEQFGFRNKHSTTVQLVRLIENINYNFNIKKYSGMVLLEKKTFDTVWHNGLIFKFIKYDFPSYIVFLITSYLTNRHFQVTVNDTLSTTQLIETGVPRGSCLYYLSLRR